MEIHFFIKKVVHLLKSSEHILDRMLLKKEEL